jgi:mannosyltransferase
MLGEFGITYILHMGSFVQKHGVLLAILILAAFLRFYHLDTESLWGDEGASLRFAHMEGALEIVEGSRTDSNYPTYYLLLHYWVALFGDSDFSFRTPSALSGLFAVFAMYKVGYLLFGRGPALIASLILALSPIHIQYSQEARVYSLMVLSALLSFYFFVKILREQSFSSQTGYVLCTCLLLYSHIYGLLILLAQNIYLTMMFLGKAFGSRGNQRLGFVRWFGLQTLIFDLYIPGFLLLLGWIQSELGHGTHLWIPSPSLRWVYDTVLVGYSGSSSLLMVLLTFSLGAAVALVRSGAADKLYLLLGWLLIPVALPLAASSVIKPIFIYKYGIAASLALYLLAAKGVVAASGYLAGIFPQGMPWAFKIKTVGIIFATGLAVLFSGELWSYYNTEMEHDCPQRSRCGQGPEARP